MIASAPLVSQRERCAETIVKEFPTGEPDFDTGCGTNKSLGGLAQQLTSRRNFSFREAARWPGFS
jgi:hypothetical protein